MKKILITLAALSGFFISQKCLATCSNYTTYTTGQTLTSSSLNSLQSNYTNCVNEILNGDTFTGNMLWYSGANMSMYSDTGSTLKFGVDGGTGNITTEGQINLGTGGVVLNDDGDGAFTITGAGNGSDENLTLNLDDTSNTAVLSTSTGVTDLRLDNIGMAIYSDSGSTLKASISASTGATIAGLTQAGQITNCGMSVSGFTFTIAGYDGTALSATNPCVVAVRSNTSGRVALSYFTSNVTFTFGSTSNTDGNLFGISEANWSNTMPFFLGVIYNGTTPYFTISRVPSYDTGSSSGGLCQIEDTDCDDQADTMILATGLTLSSFTSLPITQVGWFKMTYATSGAAWTASVTNETGFNHEYEKVRFSFPSGQMGAASGKYLTNGTGTAAVFDYNDNYYSINSAGRVTATYSMYNDDGTDGSGADYIYLSLPYYTWSSGGPTSNPGILESFLIAGPSIDYNNTCAADSVTNSSVVSFSCPTVSGTSLQTSATRITNSFFSNGSRRIMGTLIYSVLI